MPRPDSKLLLLCLLLAVGSSCASPQSHRLLAKGQTNELFSANTVVLRTEVVWNPYRSQRYFFNLFPLLEKVDSPRLVDLQLRVVSVEKGTVKDGILTINRLRHERGYPVFNLGTHWMMGYQERRGSRFKHLDFLPLEPINSSSSTRPKPIAEE